MSATLSRRAVIAAGALVAFPAISRAETYPSRPIRWIVGYTPGGTTDVLARLIANPLGKRLG